MTTIDRDELAEIVFEDWVPLYRDMAQLVEILPADKRRSAVQILRKANDLLQRITPMMRADPALEKVADALATGAVRSAADWLDRQMPKRGHAPTMSVIAQAAYELGKISKAAVGNPDWKWVQGKLKEKFGADTPRALRSLAHKAHRWKLAGIREASALPTRPSAPERPVPPTLNKLHNAGAFFTIHNIRAQRRQDLTAAKEDKRRAKRTARKAHRFQTYKPRKTGRR